MLHKRQNTTREEVNTELREEFKFHIDEKIPLWSCTYMYEEKRKPYRQNWYTKVIVYLWFI